MSNRPFNKRLRITYKDLQNIGGICEDRWDETSLHFDKMEVQGDNLIFYQSLFERTEKRIIAIYRLSEYDVKIIT